MKIAIDLQSLQGESQFRGIGKYTSGFVNGVLSCDNNHEITLILNGKNTGVIEEWQQKVNGTNTRVVVWEWPTSFSYVGNSVDDCRKAAEVAYVQFINSLNVDILHVSSFFEGFGDETLISLEGINKRTLVSVIQYDLIPLSNSEQYLTPNPLYESFYRAKIEQLVRCDLFLSISEYTRQRAIELLSVDENAIVNIQGATCNTCKVMSTEEAAAILRETEPDLKDDFILYNGGADERKNLKRLISAFSMLTKDAPDKYQLVLAGKIPEVIVQNLTEHAISCELNKSEILFTGYISSDTLVALNNMCRLNVFPSWEEGFGLPALEAMLCGAPLVCSGTSSLPEVVQNPDCYFDPLSVEGIFKKIKLVLDDDDLRTEIVQTGLKNAQKFSWNKVAETAITAFEDLYSQVQLQPHLTIQLPYEISLFNSPSFINKMEMMEPVTVRGILCDMSKSGESADRKQLLVDVSELSQRDAATGVQRVVKNYLKYLLLNPPEDYVVLPVYATLENSYKYAVEYAGQLGYEIYIPSEDFITWYPGDIFYGLDMQGHVQMHHKEIFETMKNDGVRVLFEVYDLLPIQYPDLFAAPNAGELHSSLMEMYTATSGIICISEATAVAYKNWTQQENIDLPPNFEIHSVHIGSDISEANSEPKEIDLTREQLELLEGLKDKTTFLCVSTIEPRKCQEQILEAFELLWADNSDLTIVFVGKAGWKTESLVERVESSPEFGERLVWLPGISDAFLDKLYSICTCLICASVDEGFGLSLVEGARHKIPIIARDIKVFKEVAGDNASYFTGSAPLDLKEAISLWLNNYNNDCVASSSNMKWLTWEESTELLVPKIIGDGSGSMERLPLERDKKIFIDISELINKDAGTGIQRVVRNIINEWAKLSTNYELRLVYATLEDTYRYADNFSQKFFSDPKYQDGQPIQYQDGDIFVGLDMQPFIIPARRADLDLMKQSGVKVCFVLYDLLPVTMSQYFLPGSKEGFSEWVKTICRYDKIMCISEDVSNELVNWMNQQPESYSTEVGYFHIGADFEEKSKVETIKTCVDGLDVDLRDTLERNITFLMVGTLEPRKGHAQVFEAFELLWEQNVDVNLVIIGKQGWMIDDLVDAIQSSEQLNKKLFWLNGASDRVLEDIYKYSDCLIAASYGEGFGLPIIEAAYYGVNVLARKIPVFEEIAQNGAEYFEAKNGDELSVAIHKWITQYETNVAASPDNISWLSWSESASLLFKGLTQ